MKLKPRSEKGLLTPDNCVITLIDHQPQMLFGVTSIDRQSLINNVVGFAKAARIFNATFPNLNATLLTWVNGMLPEAKESEEQAPRKGIAFSAGDRNSRRNNERIAG